MTENPPTKKTPVLCFTAELYKIFKKKKCQCYINSSRKQRKNTAKRTVQDQHSYDTKTTARGNYKKTTEHYPRTQILKSLMKH